MQPGYLGVQAGNLGAQPGNLDVQPGNLMRNLVRNLDAQPGYSIRNLGPSVNSQPGNLAPPLTNHCTTAPPDHSHGLKNTRIQRERYRIVRTVRTVRILRIVRYPITFAIPRQP